MSDTPVAEEVVTPVAPEVPKAAKAPKTKGVFVRATGGNILHLFTNVLFTQDPKKVEVDGFLQAQIDAGKVEIVSPESL